jgi:TonB-linked SusC/RagA family outer membrane protein
MRYYVSASFYDQDGSYKVSNMNGYNPNLNFQRYDFRSNVDVNVTKTTLLSMNLDAMLVNSKYPGMSSAGIWYDAYATNPVEFPIQYPGGFFAGPVNNGGDNPFNDVQNLGYTTEFHPTVQSVFSIDQKLESITPGLHAMGRFSFDSYSEIDMNRLPANGSNLWYAGSRDANGNLVLTQTNYGSQFLGYSESSTGERVMYLEGNLTYNRTFKKSTFGGLALYNMRNRIAVSTAPTSINTIPYRNQSLAGRATYSYADRYLLEFDAGYTGSENFAPGHRFGFFPAVSGGWVISKEDFFKPLAGTVSLLKIRGSYGITGNDNIGDAYGIQRFGYLTQIGGGNTADFGTTPNAYSGYTENVLGNPDLTWELSTKSDLGLEVGFKNKLNIVLDAYQDIRKHILINRQSIASFAGYSQLDIFSNLGQMQNRGMDGSIEYKDHFGKDVTFRLFGNFTYAKNKIIFQDEPTRIYKYQEGTGHQYGEFNGYVAQGLFKSQDDINQSPTQSFGQVSPGDIKYKSLANDGVINANDWTYLGKTPFPNLLYGTGFTIGYKKFDLSLMFQGVAGVGIMANGSANSYTASTMSQAASVVGGGASGVGIVPFAGEGQYPGNILSATANRWTVSNPSQNVEYPRLSVASVSSNDYLGSTWWLKSGDYCRLKQASLGYTISSRSLRRDGFSALYVYTSGVNLFTFTKFKLWDPELGSDGATYPPARTITVGVRAQF